MSQPLLSIAIMTHNEITEFAWLMEALSPHMNATTEIVVLDDFSGSDMVKLVQSFPVRFFQRALDKNFSAQRNHLKSLCRGDFIFLLDPDEIPAPMLLRCLPNLIAAMREHELDACSMPRLNRVLEASSPVDARTLKLTDDDLRTQPRDDQTKLVRNAPDIRWTNRVHERLLGARRVGRVPQHVQYAIWHVKQRSRLEGQTKFYRSILMRRLDKLRKSFAKRMGLLRPPEWIDVTSHLPAPPPAP